MAILKRISALLLALAVVLPAAAQFSIGPRVGINASSLHFNIDDFSSDNCVGFTGGLQAEFMIPMLNFGFDASVMYVHRTTDLSKGTVKGANVTSDYIEIPVNLKYKFGLPVVGQFVSPYVFTGPSFAFRTSKADVENFFADQKNCDVAWNFGLGVQLFKHLQIGASYGLGLSKAIEFMRINPAANAVPIEGKNNCWTVTAAWLF